jgi:4-hydroxybenzoyl-CoA reductase subunit beta
MRLPRFEYYAPSGLDDALKIKSDYGASVRILAGGTDLLVNLKHRLFSPAALLSIRNIKELHGIEEGRDSVVIKAGETLNSVAQHPLVRTHFPVLVKSIRSVGAVSIQHFRGTIVGNLCLQPRCILYNQSQFWRSGKGGCHRTGGQDCHALPGAKSCQSICSGDTTPVLTALSAQLTIAGMGGLRSIPIGDFFTGKGESPYILGPDEILTEIRIPVPWAPISASYKRLSFRSAVDFPLANAAVVAILENGAISRFKAVISACGPAPIALKEAENMVRGMWPSQEIIERLRVIALKEAEGVIVNNASASREYRHKMAGVMVARAAKEAFGLSDQVAGQS